MKNKILLLIITLFFISCSTSSENEIETTLPGYTNYTYKQAFNKIGIELDTYYNYKGISTTDPQGKIKFNSDQTITEIYGSTTAVFSYNFTSNNQADANQLSINLTANDKSLIPNYNPKMPVTSLAKHLGFNVHLADNNGSKKVQISGLYSYGDSSNYEKVVLIQ